MKPGDFVSAVPPGGLVRQLKVWTTWDDNLKFFAVPFDTIGTVIEVQRHNRNKWCRVLFPQGVGWVIKDNLTLIMSS